MKNYWYVLAFCLSLNVAVAQSSGVQFTEGQTWEEVLTVAKAQNKIIFLDAYTTWCGPCKKMSREVFPLEKVGEVFNEKFVNIKMDMEQPEGKKVARKYGIRAFPTLLFVNPDGEVVHRVAGFRDQKGLLDLAENASNPARQLTYMNQKYEEGNREPQFLYDYAYARLEAFSDKGYIQIASEYLATQPDWHSDKNMKFVFDFVNRTDAKMFDFVIDNRLAFNTQFGASKVTQKVEKLVSTRIDQLLSLKDGEDEKTFSAAEKLFTQVYGAKGKALTYSFKMTYYRNGGDRENFALAAINYVENMENLPAEELADIAWTFYQVIDDEDQLKKALSWAKTALKAEKEVSYFDTVGSLYYKLEQPTKAKRIAKKGIKFAEKNGETFDSLNDLIEMINKK